MLFPAQALGQTQNSVSPDKASEETALLTLREQYAGQFREYVQAEREAQLAISQFNQLQTLESLNTSIDATKDFLVIRDQVLITYLELIRTNVVNTLGIPVAQKELLNNDLLLIGQELENHMLQAQAITAKEDLVPVLVAFEPVAQQFTGIVEVSQNWMLYGRVRIAFDKTSSLFEFVKTELAQQDVSELEKARLDRDLAVITEQMDAADVALFELEQQLNTGISYVGINEILLSPYSTISRALNFIEEVAHE